MTATAAIVHDKRTCDKAGRYPVKIRITFERKTRLYRTSTRMSEDDFKKMLAINPRRELKQVKQNIFAFLDKAEKICTDLGTGFTFDKFKERYEGKRNNKANDDLNTLFLEYIENSQNDINTINLYKTALNSLLEFSKKSISIKQITPVWLTKYETYMIRNGKTTNTISIYIRALRSIFNRAIKKGIISDNSSPFKGDESFKIPNSVNMKKALSKESLKKLLTYEPEPDCEPWKIKAYHLWVFSYLCNGINVKDICLLKWSDLTDTNIYYNRAKTASKTRQKQKQIVVPRIAKVNQIINEIGTNDSKYVFGLITGHETPDEQLARIKQITKNINKWIGRISVEIGLPDKVTTYTARHSFATMLKRGGVPIAFISESLGHSDQKTTDNYLDSIEDDQRHEINEKLLNFD